MEHGVVRVYYGEGRGKSTAALGDAIRAACEGQNAIITQFLKKKEGEEEVEFLNRLEPEIMRFRFAKMEDCFDDLSENERREESVNLVNGFHYGKKVVSTGESTFVVFDEILGLVDQGLISVEMIQNLIDSKPEETTLIFTGRTLTDEIRNLADEVYHITSEK
ncbi:MULTISPECIES: cob(I)yrinic acid a,c-diamide adenosyltransferase [Agathobacter]|uniref:Cob(I)yrinic acid a c-diamide adenosyltransferase n=1 Tax=Agathobacter ruminis TaxID=1712665 RepID=A0A2G3E0A1_9FIRM|nr:MULTISPECIES: cob(I)yrinic acid a,c-diamide adenosyltransferase [Agathobacter]MBQ1680803.1 cob(I)yrinic acid a,c-diamide adenosyltransferase [Agathobacter sp.]MDC7300420.1 cob(I)yrinic acid a,c-diamide adenosyltransferase [Agathobacter ruminis]PHU36706.1 cob(I)yrinic acid a c-diamide adenosyltransferase [Agathobacter ruminis]